MRIGLVAVLLWGSICVAADPWPGETAANATLLTGLDVLMQTDLSGSHWDPAAQRLWVTKPGRTWALQRSDAGTFSVRGTWSVGDEGITAASYGQRNDTSGRVLILIESGQVLDVNAPFGSSHQTIASWSLAELQAATSGNAGPEGIAFVPNGVLVDAGFVDATGALRTSARGMGGLVLVAHQNGGDLFAFDLGADAGYDFVGRYKTGYTESSGLELDRSTGILYVSHNTAGNFVELVSLRSVASGANGRRLVALREYRAPASTNLEGFAVAPQAGADREPSCWYTEDHESAEPGADKARSLQWYKTCPLAGPDAGAPQADAGRDAGPADGGATDSGTPDAGGPQPDAGSPGDSGSTDAGAPMSDAGALTDAGSSDAGASDAGTADAGPFVVDAGGSPDAAVADDGGTPSIDGGAPADAGTTGVDGGSSETIAPPGCGCQETGGAGWLVLAALLLTRRKR